MEIIRFEDLALQPWKNGGGVTREIAARREAGALQWRLSIADVASAGPFSFFPGLLRVLTVIEGDGLILRHAAGAIDAPRLSPVHFPGDLEIDGALVRGPVRDFNLIYDPAFAAMDVMALGAGKHRAAGIGALFLCGGEIGGTTVPPLSFARFDGDAALDFAAAGVALLVTADQPRAVSLASVFR